MNNMDFIKLFNIDSWWKVVLWIGIALCGIVLIFDVKIVEAKHLLGLGLGLIIVGISIFGAQKYYVQQVPELNGIFEGHVTRHNAVTSCGLIIGSIISIVFLFLLLKGLL